MKYRIEEAARIIREASRTAAFTGAGISVESGIPPFRGTDGLWNTYDPSFLHIDFFRQNPEESWELIRKIFYDCFGRARPNAAHYALAEMEKQGRVQTVITQNIDNLHHEAGSRCVYEFHGNSRKLVCQGCGSYYPVRETDFSFLPPRCGNCRAVLKPDFVFFGEPIPEGAARLSFQEADDADVFILIGTTGEVMPAALIPFEAKKKGKTIIEINIGPSQYTAAITDIFLRGKAASVMEELSTAIKQERQ